MEEWYCFKCKDKMVEKDISYNLLGIIRSTRGLQCPKCKTTYVLEKTLTEEIKKLQEAGDIKT